MADKSKLGYEFPTHTLDMEKSKISEFAMAVSQKEVLEEVNPIYTDETAAKQAGYSSIAMPPTFPTSVLFRTGGGFMGVVNALGIDQTKLLHCEEEYEYFGTVCAGDIITAKMKVVSMYDKARRAKPEKIMEFTILETEMVNQRGELVIKARSKLVEQ